jgi:hypothetical protein
MATAVIDKTTKKNGDVFMRLNKIKTAVRLMALGMVMFAPIVASAAVTGKSSKAAESGYVWANEPSSASYTPSTYYSFNSSGGANTILRSGVGRYTVNLYGLVAGGGHVQVTAYGPSSDTCKVANWGVGGTYLSVNVNCYNHLGQPVDTYYTLYFVN